MFTLSVPQTSYVHYEITDADIMVLDLFLNLDSSWYVENRRAEHGGLQKVAAIKWFRVRFNCGLKEAKDAVEAYMKRKGAVGG